MIIYLGLRARRVPVCIRYIGTVHCDGVDLKIVVKFMTVFVARRDSAYS